MEVRGLPDDRRRSDSRPGLTIERMVELAQVSRANFYRFSEEAKPDRDMDLRDALQRIASEWPSYGRPRITAELRRGGGTVNPNKPDPTHPIARTAPLGMKNLRTEPSQQREATPVLAVSLHRPEEERQGEKRVESADCPRPPARFRKCEPHCKWRTIRASRGTRPSGLE